MNGVEWLVEAHGCEPARLTDLTTLKNMFDEIVLDLDLRVVGVPEWHTFPAPGGITGLVLLSESHLTVHTFPEHASACINLFCCRVRADWPFEERLGTLLGATQVVVRRVEREYVNAAVAAT